MVPRTTILTVLICSLCIYISVAYVLQKQFHIMEQLNVIQRQFHTSEIAAQHETLQHLQVQRQHHMKMQNETASLHSDLRDLWSKSFVTLSYIVKFQEDLRRQIQQLHQDETTEQREMRFDLQLHMRDVTAAHYTNRQMQMVHWMQMQNLTSDFRNLAKRSFLMDSNIVQMQEDLHVQDEKQQLRMHNVTAALDANLHMQMQHWMQMQNLTSEFRNFRT